MVYKILTVGDPHVKVTNLGTIKRLQSEIIKLINEIKPDGVIVLGDTHDTHANMHVMSFLAEQDFLGSLEQASPGWFKFLIGNHEIPTNNLFLSKIHAFAGNPAAVDHPEVIKSPVGDFALVPYTPNGRFKEALDLIPGYYKTIFCHQEFAGANTGSIISKHGDDWPDGGDLIVSGHIHKKQRLKENIIYVGTPYQVSFGEDQDKSIAVFEYTKESYSVKYYDINMPKKITIVGTCDQIVELLKNMENTDNEYRVFIEDSAVNIEKFKKSKKFQEIEALAKIVPKPLDTAFQKKGLNKRSFLDIVRESAAAAGDAVLKTYEKVSSGINS